ncbi:hypothetical protein [Lactobacillus sp. ESL0259]|uniref:hypothetical protein n=1 Tax=Lactobacillus sp. ESL0259 TaxID=2069346 RepID=UPI000EFD0371|nr:hypothetical protein [Lactobacillus sp. ESL0259]RMC58850.1 hypothetical protein F5ESL0259_08110 [Lactobacillus sp. ESL0259]
MQDKKQLYQDNLTQKQVVNKGIAHSFLLYQFPQSASQDRIDRKQGKEKESNSFAYSLRVIIPSKNKPD